MPGGATYGVFDSYLACFAVEFALSQLPKVVGEITAQPTLHGQPHAPMTVPIAATAQVEDTVYFEDPTAPPALLLDDGDYQREEQVRVERDETSEATLRLVLRNHEQCIAQSPRVRQNWLQRFIARFSLIDIGMSHRLALRIITTRIDQWQPMSNLPFSC